VQDVAAGEIVNGENVRAIRPGEGCSPALLENVRGMSFKESFARGTPLSLDKLTEIQTD
jgi:N-acetylneuraminate synthase